MEVDSKSALRKKKKNAPVNYLCGFFFYMDRN